MSRITTVRDALAAMITTELPTYRQIGNPYAIERNAEFGLVKAWGIAFGPGDNTRRITSCKFSVLRSFTVLLINQIVSTEHDVTGRATAEKAIFEDQFKLIKSLETDTSLQGAANKADFIGDGGLEFLDSDRGKYFLLETEIAIEYFESTT